MTQKERFKTICLDNIKRNGITNLLEMLDKTDFYTAPASRMYHGNYEGGLVDHCLNVYQILKEDTSSIYSQETIAIVALFHDLCKVGYYGTEMRNTKDAKGQWVKVPYYTIDDKLPFGHGEKSVYMISEFLKLTVEEAMAIRWHMGGFEPTQAYSSISKAYQEFPLAVFIHTADLKATYLMDEKGKS
jgi:hypothetical protein